MNQSETRSPWLYVFAAPVAMVTISSLLTDPRELGERSEAAAQPIGALVGLGVFVIALVGGMWRYSIYSRRTLVAMIQVAVTGASLTWLATGALTTVGWWDIAVDLVWAVTTALQVFGKPR